MNFQHFLTANHSVDEGVVSYKYSFWVSCNSSYITPGYGHTSPGKYVNKKSRRETQTVPKGFKRNLPTTLNLQINRVFDRS